MLEIDVGGCDYADIGFLRFGRAYADEFSGFQNSQQAGLGGKRQLADLVQKDGALVRSLEISLPRLIGSGKRAFLMSEELGLDGALGDRSAVDGDVVVVLAGAVSMYNFGYHLLTHAALAGNEYGQTGSRDLYRGIYRTVESRIIAYDSETIFDFAEFHVCKVIIFCRQNSNNYYICVYFRLKGQ